MNYINKEEAKYDRINLLKKGLKQPYLTDSYRNYSKELLANLNKRITYFSYFKQAIRKLFR